ncbi:MAG: hypothetical protein AB7T49_06920 [Oligoflexales bacterium]
MWKRVKDYGEFRKLVGILSLVDLEDIEVNILPASAFGFFEPDALAQLIKYCHDNPGTHIVSMIHSESFVNRCIFGSSLFYLATGDSDPNLIFDPIYIIDELCLQSLNSELNSSRPYLNLPK